MRILIVDDQFSARRTLQLMLSELGPCDIAVSGAEAVEAFELAHAENKPYDLIFMDIILREESGHEALRTIRGLEDSMGVGGKGRVAVVMASASDDAKDILGAFFDEGCEGYIVKPFSKDQVMEQLKKLELIK